MVVSLGATYDHGNIFAKILRGDAPSVPVYENKEVLAFMDAFPQAEGHVLVISKTSFAKNILEIDPSSLQRLIVLVQKIAAAVSVALKPDGVFVAQANGRAAGQTVDHFHFHIIPRWEGQPMKGHGHGEMADPGHLKMIAKRIAIAIVGESLGRAGGC
jgi:histidine triad (HIT) family protein